MNRIDFTFSDTIAGYVTQVNRERGTFGLKTSDGREFHAALTPTSYAELARNLDEPYADCTAQLSQMLTPGRYLFAYGIFYPNADGYAFEAKHLVMLGRGKDEYRFEAPDW